MIKSQFWCTVKTRQIFILLIFAWFLINIIQSLFTEIGNDEAYYWVYSQYPDWGYFDHPPMIALVIKIGTLLAGNTLIGVNDTTAGLSFCTLQVIRVKRNKRECNSLFLSLTFSCNASGLRIRSNTGFSAAFFYCFIPVELQVLFKE